MRVNDCESDRIWSHLEPVVWRVVAGAALLDGSAVLLAIAMLL